MRSVCQGCTASICNFQPERAAKKEEQPHALGVELRECGGVCRHRQKPYTYTRRARARRAFATCATAVVQQGRVLPCGARTTGAEHVLLGWIGSRHSSRVGRCACVRARARTALQRSSSRLEPRSLRRAAAPVADQGLLALSACALVRVAAFGYV